jgi:hypothetical protein
VRLRLGLLQIAVASCATTAGCRGASSSSAPPPAGDAHLARDADHVAPVGILVPWSCTAARCRATFPDGGALDATIAPGGRALRWQLDGLLINAATLARYLDETLADLGRPGPARCGAAHRLVAPGALVRCELPAGGRAWATVNADGTFAVELALEPDVARVRDPDLTDELEPELERRSRALAITVDETAELPRDGGADAR